MEISSDITAFIGHFFRYPKCFHTCEGLKQSSEPNDEPVKYSTSKAASYSLLNEQYANRHGSSPTYVRWSFKLSFAAFFIYFLFLRRENDINDILEQPLDVTMKQMEEQYSKQK